ncbi:TENA protein, partial [Amia calva]|nr:TENA protein [Amia calva]
MDCSTRSCPANCNNRGQCVNGKCVCDTGFTGMDCSTRSCRSDCSNHGHCLSGRCVCESGFTGNDCSLPLCPGDCSGHGRCVEGECSCDPGYTGLDCGAVVPVVSKFNTNNITDSSVTLTWTLPPKPVDTYHITLISKVPTSSFPSLSLPSSFRFSPSSPLLTLCISLLSISLSLFTSLSLLPLSVSSRPSGGQTRTVRETVSTLSFRLWQVDMYWTALVAGLSSSPSRTGSLQLSGKRLNSGIQFVNCGHVGLPVVFVFRAGQQDVQLCVQPLFFGHPCVLVSASFSGNLVYCCSTIPVSKEGDQKVTSKVRGDLSSYTQTGLAPAQDYRVSIRGERANKLGPESIAEFKTLISGPKNVRVVKTTSSSVLIQWDRSVSQIDRYRLTFSPSDGGEGLTGQKTISPERETTLINGLEAGLRYDVTLTAEQGRSRSLPATIQATPAGHRHTHTHTHTHTETHTHAEKEHTHTVTQAHAGQEHTEGAQTGTHTGSTGLRDTAKLTPTGQNTGKPEKPSDQSTPTARLGQQSRTRLVTLELDAAGTVQQSKPAAGGPDTDGTAGQPPVRLPEAESQAGTTMDAVGKDAAGLDTEGTGWSPTDRGKARPKEVGRQTAGVDSGSYLDRNTVELLPVRTDPHAFGQGGAGVKEEGREGVRVWEGGATAGWARATTTTTITPTSIPQPGRKQPPPPTAASRAPHSPISHGPGASDSGPAGKGALDRESTPPRNVELVSFWNRTSHVLLSSPPSVAPTLLAPPPGPGALQVQNLSSSGFLLLWDAPPGLYHSFTITRTQLDTEREGRVVKLVSGSTRSLSIWGLQPQTHYAISLFGTAHGRDSPTQRLTVTTGPAPPSQLMFSNVSDSSVLVSWLPPRSSVSSFKITYIHTDEGEPHSVSVSGQQSSVSLTSLTPGSTYKVSVLSVLGLEESDPITGVVVTVPDPPSDLRVVNVTDSRALLLWRPALVNVDRYVIVYRAQDEPEVSVSSSGNSVELQLKGLQGETLYSVTVTSLRGREHSPPASTSFTTASGVGGRGEEPRDLTANQVKPRSAMLSWKPPHTAVSGYWLTYQTDRQETQEVTLDPGVTQHKLVGLVPESQYTVRLRALRGEQHSADSTAHFTTGSLRFPFPVDCSQELLNGMAESGETTVYPGGQRDKPLRVYCDMETDGGGWIVFQRRMNGKTNFFRFWKDYRDGFGNLTEEFWLGNKALHLLTREGAVSLRVDLRAEGQAVHALYSSFNVTSEHQHYRLTVGGYSGTAGDALQYHDGRPFSTRDRDPQHQITRCAMSYKGGWWYKNCHYANLNGLYNTHRNHQGVIWTNWKGNNFSIAFTEMKLRPAGFSPSSPA